MQPSYTLSHSQAFPEMIPNAQVLQDMINRLQQENTALKAEHTAMQLMLNQPDQSALSDGFLNISLKSLPITTMPFLNDWKAFCMTVQGQASSAMAFIEDANGQELASEKITNVLQTMQSIWHEFHTHGLVDAQTTWTLMLLQVKKAFHSELIQAFPELNFCKDSWKSDLLAKKHYLSFKQTWFTNRMDEKTNSTTKHKTKSKVAEDTDSQTGVRNIKCMKIDIFMAPDNRNDDGLQADSANMSSMPVIPVVPTLNTVEQEDDTGISMAAWLIKNPLSSLHPPPVVRDFLELIMTISECMSTIDKGESQVKAPSTTNGPTTHRWNEEEGVAFSFEQEWQKQVGRSLEEFNKYFDELPSKAKVKYKDEANNLTGKQEQWGEGSVDEREHRQCKGGLSYGACHLVTTSFVQWPIQVAAAGHAAKANKRAENIKTYPETDVGLKTLSSDTEREGGTADQCSWDGAINCLALDSATSNDDSQDEVDVWELEGTELLQSLELCFTKEHKLLTTPTPYQLLQHGARQKKIAILGTMVCWQEQSSSMIRGCGKEKQRMLWCVRDVFTGYLSDLPTSDSESGSGDEDELDSGVDQDKDGSEGDETTHPCPFPAQPPPPLKRC
ncbi:hypothetical protein F5J12DRAFT_783914 [Pisolithus orientalis]|uniref:uncharacterized protein n=1 Tax=Pisolithus orientalis TaxID=936130 RepID=UPI0022241374|nr:uncharacterized protein F5J12DRAFT_783914 [Pisolithus orientalis]KAI6002451.1 hypothetical protein F5J12DRAFT_783914 [Pisolithus orientalis]